MKNYFKDPSRIMATAFLLTVDIAMLVKIGIYNWYTLGFTALTLVLIIAMYREANKK